MSSIFEAGNVAVVTGAALGIGFAAARHCAGAGMRVVMVDLASRDLDAAADTVRGVCGADHVLKAPVDVSDAKALGALASRVAEEFGTPAFLMNNAATRVGGGVFAEPAKWHACFDVNFWGVVNGVNAFAPAMVAARTGSQIVNVGSKQGITNPPGNGAYNATKAAVKSYTETLQHELRNLADCAVTAHLLVPGWTTTGKREHKPGAWRPEQVVERLVEGLARGSFYIVCPDDEVTEEMDAKRIIWSAMDITEDRPPLSRWHGGFGAEFDAFEP
jgi:hypothetical protein